MGSLGVLALLGAGVAFVLCQEALLSAPLDQSNEDDSWRAQAIARLWEERQKMAHTPVFKYLYPGQPHVDILFKNESATKTGSLKHRYAWALMMWALLEKRVTKDLQPLSRHIKAMAALLTDQEVEGTKRRKQMMSMLRAIGRGHGVSDNFWRSVMKETKKFDVDCLFHAEIKQGIKDLLMCTENPLLLMDCTGNLELNEVRITNLAWRPGKPLEKDAEALPPVAFMVMTVADGPCKGKIAIRRLSRRSPDKLVRVIVGGE